MICAGRAEASFSITPDLFFHLSFGETTPKLQGLHPSLFGALVFIWLRGMILHPRTKNIYL